MLGDTAIFDVSKILIHKTELHTSMICCWLGIDSILTALLQ